LKIPNEELLKKKSKILRNLSKLNEESRKIIFTPENIVPFLVPGRIIKIKHENTDWGWGIVVNFNKQNIKPKSINVVR
jgi:ATP-dependent RNA helicase DOB1